ncbi:MULTISPECIES: hypothetical protein [unclassified Burkholderia]|uniref:hypothetical protein n=1 Tax=unclassified Burkholderia TaxID=2613784 RepID=UPI000F5864BC|nr:MULTISPECIES: hypothetical protein [unclassified Burkholderia]
MSTTQSIPLDALRLRRTDVLAADRLFFRWRMQHPDAIDWAAAVRQQAEGPNRMSRTPKLLL